MNGYLDIHSHIIPGVDDGSEDFEMSLKLIEKAYEEGVRYMVATPHFYPGHRNASVERIQDEYSKLAEAIKDKHPDMKLMLGNEIYYKDEVISLIEEKRIFTMNGGNYILVEFNVNLPYKTIYEAIKKFTSNGYYPIMAHIERYSCLHKREDLVDQLISTGAYMQINADTFLGGMFDQYTRFALKLFRNGKVHFLGSDCHDLERRVPVMDKAVEVLKKKVNSEVLEQVLIYNKEKFLANDFI